MKNYFYEALLKTASHFSRFLDLDFFEKLQKMNVK